QGVPWRKLDIEGELVTPTGAAIIAEIASEFGPLPAMAIESIGYGAGKGDFGIPNVLRVMIGEEVIRNSGHPYRHDHRDKHQGPRPPVL
ncbi:MAG: hypothetical protein C0390_05065, partial [Syntrophus sp. (in: bacteria)]|nr:hypothetical protein [Syntrophus sp. (in: bacteria)]